MFNQRDRLRHYLMTQALLIGILYHSQRVFINQNSKSLNYRNSLSNPDIYKFYIYKFLYLYFIF